MEDMMKTGFSILLFVFLVSSSTGCIVQRQPALTIMVHDSFRVSEDVIERFESQNQVSIKFIMNGDGGTVLNQAILTKNAPIADILFGVDNSFLSRALDAELFIPYHSAELANIPDSFKLDPQDRELPVDYGDVCINYDKAWFSSRNLPVPASLEDLLKPEYKNLLVVENPAISSPGLAFLMVTIAHFSESGYRDYWQALRSNGVVVVNDWTTAYYTNFSGSSGKGAQPMVVSYASSPAAEVYFANPAPATSPTASITGRDTCFRQIEFVGILKGTKNLPLAQKFIDFLLGKAFQEDIPLKMIMYPVNSTAALPDLFVKYAQSTTEPVLLDPLSIAQNRNRWISDWTSTVLK
jgi:thiamine transport system substrate-binding protein